MMAQRLKGQSLPSPHPRVLKLGKASGMLGVKSQGYVVLSPFPVTRSSFYHQSWKNLHVTVTKGGSHFVTLGQGSANIKIFNLSESCFSFYLFLPCPVSKQFNVVYKTT